MKKIIFLTIVFAGVMSATLRGQNVGQSKTDTVKNYIDINGNRQGFWSKKYKNGKIAYKAFFKNNKLIGNYYRYYPNGQVSVWIRYDKANPDKLAPATYYWDDGKIMAKGFFINQHQKDSVWEYYTPSGKLKIKTHYAAGKKHGKEYIYYRNGQITQEATYVNGVLHGPTVRYFDNGAKQIEMMYKNGKLNGHYVVYYLSGKTKTDGFYKNNLKESTWLYFNERGALDRKITYHGGVADNQDELDSLFTKEAEEWEKNKGKYKEPTIEDFFQNGKRKNQTNINGEY